MNNKKFLFVSISKILSINAQNNDKFLRNFQFDLLSASLEEKKNYVSEKRQLYKCRIVNSHYYSLSFHAE